LNRYKNFKDYVNAKKSIFKYQGKNDVLFLNKDNKYTMAFAKEVKSKVMFFKKGKSAVKVAQYFKISKKDIKKVLSIFKGIPHRQELIAMKRGVKYINDTTATNPKAVIFAIETFRKRFSKSKIILIAGGEDKKLIYRSLARNIKDNVDYVVLLPGTGSNKLKKELGSFFKEPSSFRVKSMKQAVRKAFCLAQKGDIVLLSPGAASFNLFENEFDRGNQFVKAVKRL